jgi:predicted DNA-binding ribbon-helix-helix protein
MKSPVVKRSVALAKHKTSISLEEEFWEALKQIAGLLGMNVQDLVTQIDKDRNQGNLSSAVRLFVLAYYKDRQPPINAAVKD